MASLSRDRQGNAIIQFMVGSHRRRSLWLGKVNEKSAIETKEHVEELLAAKRSGRAPFKPTADWLARIGVDLYSKLTAKDLAPKRVEAGATNLLSMVNEFIAERSEMKPWTKTNYKQARRCLVAFFGEKRDPDSITPADADDFRRWLSKSKKAGGQGLADNTTRKRCAIARQFFRDAVRRRLISINPFGDMKSLSVQPNRERDYFVTRSEAEAVLAACPCNEWRVIFALARYGGLRTPSETLALRWNDVDWVNERIRIVSSKTARHTGKGSRVIPLFPELRPYLIAARNEANPGMDVPLSSHVVTTYRDRGVNLRSRLLDIIWSAGLTEWPKLFMSLRASRATELASQFPAYVAAEWIGHSTKVAQDHYWRVTDEDFRRAVSSENANLHKPVHFDGANSLESASAETESAENATSYHVIPSCTSVQVLPVGLEPTTY